MNVWRGLFRLWVVATGLWIIFVVIVTSTFAIDAEPPRQNYILTDLEIGEFQINSYPLGLNWERNYREYNFRNNIHFLIKRSIPQNALDEWFENNGRKYTWTRNYDVVKERVRIISWGSGIAIFIPAVFLLLGFVLRWAVEGFYKAAK